MIPGHPKQIGKGSSGQSYIDDLKAPAAALISGFHL
jgi:hypothetical protein